MSDVIAQLEANLRKMSVAEKLMTLDAMEVSAHQHNDVELRRHLAVLRQKVREGKL